MFKTDGAIQKDLPSGLNKTAEVPMGPQNYSEVVNNDQFPGVPRGEANLRKGDGLQAKI